MASKHVPVIVNPHDTVTDAASGALRLAQRRDDGDWTPLIKVRQADWDDTLLSVASQLYHARGPDAWEHLPARPRYHVRHVAAGQLIAQTLLESSWQLTAVLELLDTQPGRYALSLLTVWRALYTPHVPRLEPRTSRPWGGPEEPLTLGMDHLAEPTRKEAPRGVYA